MKVRHIAKRPPPRHPIASRIVVIRSFRQFEKMFGPTPEETERARAFFAPTISFDLGGQSFTAVPTGLPFPPFYNIE